MMPFRYAPQAIAGLIVLTVVGFWPGYFSVLGTAPWGYHFHGITASLWLILLAFQSWSAQQRRFALHRAYGIASLALFPLFLAGGLAVVLTMAASTAAGSPFYQVYGARLGTMDINSVVLLGILYYGALADRRRVQLHARWLLATPLPLIMPIIGRVINDWVPGLVMHGPQDFPLFAWGVRLSGGIALALTAWLYATAPRRGKPFLIAGAALLLQSVAFETIGRTTWWGAAFRALAALPIAPMLLAATVVGLAIDWFGWQAGRAPARRATFNTG